MGSQASKHEPFGSSCQELIKSYEQNLFMSNRKSKVEFKEQMRSIKKRSACFTYSWIAKFINEVKDQELYYEYTSVLRQNCIRQGRKIAPLLPTTLRDEFVRQFTAKHKSMKPTTANIGEAINECKCYLLITKWLNQLVTLKNLRGKENPQLHLQAEKGIEPIYRLLANLIQTQHSAYPLSHKPLSLQDPLILKYLKAYQFLTKFQDKQILILLISNRLQYLEKSQNQQHFFQNILLQIAEAMGIVKCYAIVRLVHELGSVDIEKVWKIIDNKMKSD